MSRFALRLKELRQMFGLTQDEFAKKMGISRSTVGMYEKGNREPDYDTLEAFADFFNVDVDYLLGRSDKTTIIPGMVYYTNPATARLAQEMFEDPDLRALHHMKRNMDPEKFKAHMDMMKQLYKIEHPEDDDDFSGS